MFLFIPIIIPVGLIRRLAHKLKAMGSRKRKHGVKLQQANGTTYAGKSYYM